MLIRRMTAFFGKLQGQTLELQEGLNILQAPNETGKSTWCAFLLSMLYGINSRERNKVGFIADKNRYAPWSGGAMSGRLDCLAGGEELTVTRSTRRPTAPMGECRILYAGTGDPVPSLTGQNCGEALVGVSREVYERSAFIRQAELPISQDVGLERRVAALITSGEEDVSYSEAVDLLKKQLNRRRHNKTGQLPALEAELQDTERQIAQAEELEAQLADARAQAEALAGQAAALEEELALHDRWEQSRRAKALAGAEEALREAEEQASSLRRAIQRDGLPETEAIGRLRGAIVNLRQAGQAALRAQGEAEKAAAALSEAEEAVQAHPFAGKTPEEAEALPLDLEARPRLSPLILAVILLAALALSGAVYLGGGGLLPAIGGGCGLFGLLFLTAGLLTGKKQKAWEIRAAALRRQRSQEVQAYRELYQTMEAARRERDAKTAAWEGLSSAWEENRRNILAEIRRFAPAVTDDLSADQALRECALRRKALAEAEAALRERQLRYDLLCQQAPAGEEEEGELSAPVRSREAVLEAQSRNREALDDARSAADRLTGRLHAAGDPLVLRSSADHLREEIRRLEGECSALRLALEALEEANTRLQSRFSPALGRRTGEIFSALTGGRYTGAALDRAFHLSAEPAGEALYRDAALLSAGTADQLYLAARLAICELVLPAEDPAPIVLDDALASFDDQRCAAALEWLRREAQSRQILLFTCHSREAELLKDDPAVSIQHLTALDGRV